MRAVGWPSFILHVRCGPFSNRWWVLFQQVVELVFEWRVGRSRGMMGPASLPPPAREVGAGLMWLGGNQGGRCGWPTRFPMQRSTIWGVHQNPWVLGGWDGGGPGIVGSGGASGSKLGPVSFCRLGCKGFQDQGQTSQSCWIFLLGWRPLVVPFQNGGGKGHHTARWPVGYRWPTVGYGTLGARLCAGGQPYQDDNHVDAAA